MMDSTSAAKGGSADNHLKISAVSGKIERTYAGSKFVVCGKDSSAFDFRKPRIKYINGDRWGETEIVVLQAMIIENGLFLCEVIDKDMFDKHSINESSYLF